MPTTRKIKGKNILITGGAGFIGSHLADELISHEPGKLVVVDNFFLGKEENLELAKNFPRFQLYRQDASHYGVMEDIIKKEKIDTVFNLATKALLYSFVDPNDAYMVNVDIASVLLQLLHKGYYENLVHFSSSEVYGTARYVPIDESHPMFPETLYAAGKASADMIVQSYFRTFDLDISIVRPFNNYGPRQNEGSYAAVIPITVKRILNGERPILEGDGKQTRDFIFVGDTVRAALDIYKNRKTRGQVINIATGKETTIKEIIQTICDVTEYNGPWEFKPKRVGDVRRHLGDISLAKKLIGFKPDTDLHDGLRETVGWYKTHLSSLDKNGRVSFSRLPN